MGEADVNDTIRSGPTSGQLNSAMHLNVTLDLTDNQFSLGILYLEVLKLHGDNLRLFISQGIPLIF